MAEPWYDYLAVPVAPLLLVLQFILGRRLPRPWWQVVTIASPVAIVAMLAYLLTIDTPPGDPNIGAGLMLIWLVTSLVIAGRTHQQRRAAPSGG